MFSENGGPFARLQTATAVFTALAGFLLLKPAASFAQSFTLSPSNQFLAAGAANATVNAAISSIPDGTTIFFGVTAGSNSDRLEAPLSRAEQSLRSYTQMPKAPVRTHSVLA